MKSLLLLIGLLLSFSLFSQQHTYKVQNFSGYILVIDSNARDTVSYPKNTLSVYNKGTYLSLFVTSSRWIAADWTTSTIHALAPTIHAGDSLLNLWIFSDTIGFNGYWELGGNPYADPLTYFFGTAAGGADTIVGQTSGSYFLFADAVLSNYSLGGGTAPSNTGALTNCYGFQAGYGNSGQYLNSIGYETGFNNSGSYVDILGTNDAGKTNTQSNVMLLGRSPYTKYDSTAVFSNDFKHLKLPLYGGSTGYVLTYKSTDSTGSWQPLGGAVTIDSIAATGGSPTLVVGNTYVITSASTIVSATFNISTATNGTITVIFNQPVTTITYSGTGTGLCNYTAATVGSKIYTIKNGLLY